MADTEQVPEDFRSLLTRAEAAARGLEYPVLSWQPSAGDSPPAQSDTPTQT